MISTVKKKWLWLAALVLIFFAGYCALGILQALSLYQGERVLINLRLWGSLMLSGLIGAGICIVFAARGGKHPPHSYPPVKKPIAPSE